MIKLIAFDLDNVLIDGETIDEISKLMGVEEETAQLTKQAMEGDLDFETSLKERIKLLKGASCSDVKKIVEKVPLMNGAEETIKELKKRGYKIATITGNFEIIAEHVKDKLNLDYACYNTLHEEDGILTGEISGPLIKTDSKAEVLTELLKSLNLKASESAAVGDGANDISMLKKAGLGVAFNAKPVVKEIADVIVKEKDLRELIEIFDSQKEKSTLEVDLHKNFDTLLKEKRALEKQLKEIIKERDALNDEARVHKNLRNDLNSSAKENLDKALNYRKQRDEANREVKKYKKLRDETNQELKKLEWSSGKRDIKRIEDEIKKTDKTIETKVLDIRKENELVKKVTELQKELQTMKEDEEAHEEAVELKTQSETYHNKVVELSDHAQETHDEMIKYFNNIDEIRRKADEAHAEYLKIRDEATAKHEQVKTLLKEIKLKNKALDKVKAQNRHRGDREAEKNNQKEKEKAEEIFRKFLGGKKLTTEELLLLQKHNIG